MKGALITSAPFTFTPERLAQINLARAKNRIAARYLNKLNRDHHPKKQRNVETILVNSVNGLVSAATEAIAQMSRAHQAQVLLRALRQMQSHPTLNPEAPAQRFALPPHVLPLALGSGTQSRMRRPEHLLAPARRDLVPQWLH